MGVDDDALPVPEGPDAVAEWKARLLAVIVLWRQAAELVFADVATTTDIRWSWQVALHEDEDDWPARPSDHEPAAYWSLVTQHPPGWEPPRRPLLLPELWLEAAKDATSLGAGYDLNQAVGFVASCLQDWVMDDIQHAWPECPWHQHGADLGNLGGAPTWVCPLGDRLIAEVGKLGGAA
ncbi:MAG TPA: hypothetical protein VII50_06635 [Acidothermaceae bacterium]